MVDVRHKLIRGYRVTAADVHNSRVFEKLLTENTSRDVWADSAYRSAERLEGLKKAGYREDIQRKGHKGSGPCANGSGAGEQGARRILEPDRACVWGAAPACRCIGGADDWAGSGEREDRTQESGLQHGPFGLSGRGLKGGAAPGVQNKGQK